VTAGPTREYIDPVRFISNDSSGKMGFAIAAAAAARGHSVTLVHGPVALTPPEDVRSVAITSAEDLLRVCQRIWHRHDVLIMAAAVADYTPAKPSARKISQSRAQRTLRLRPTPDVVATLAQSRRAGQLVVGFALEDTDGRRRAQRKMVQKSLDAIVLNAPSAISHDRSAVQVLTRTGGWQAWRAQRKADTANRLVQLAETLLEARSSEKTPGLSRSGSAPAARRPGLP
jgi:phosphopantothenoylcysteine decarboxylase/phosphopantothenate--cysteine ligase